MMTISEIREACKAADCGLEAFYCKGELFINKPDGKTVWNEYMGWQAAQELCADLELDIMEV